jgi:hypothetical protein
MTGWFSKATQVLQRREPEPQAYDVACACGHRLSGVRRLQPQSVPCNRCGNFVFVLPADVYPQPKPRKKGKKAAVAAAAAAATPEGDGIALVPIRSSAVRVGELARSLSEGLSRRAHAGASSVRSAFTPFRLIVLAIAMVVGATGYYAWRSRLNENAASSLHGFIEAGDQALANRDVQLAADQFRKAARALDRLERDDVESMRIRQKSKELHAAANLSTVSLYELCDRARQEAADAKTKAPPAMEGFEPGAWIIVDGQIVDESGPDGVQQPTIRYPFPIDGAPVAIDARLAALECLGERAGARRVIVAAQIASIKKEGRRSPMWVVKLNDATALLWSDPDTYRALGVESDHERTDEETRKVLDGQSNALGLKP